MFKNLSLGAKLGLGFGIVVFISLVIGIVAVANMKSVQTTTNIVVKENIPEVQILSDVERNLLNVMYQMRGYVFSHKESFFEEGTKYLNEVKQSVKAAKELSSSSSRLTALREASDKLEGMVLNYEKLAGETAAQIRLQEQELKDLIPVGEKFLNNSQDLYKALSASLDKSIAAANSADAAKYAKELSVVNIAFTTGLAARKDVWQALSTQNMEPMNRAEDGFAQVAKKMKELESVESDKDNLAKIQAVSEASTQYIKGLNSLANAFEKIQELGKVRGEVATKVLDLAKNTALSGMGDTTVGSQKAASALQQSSFVIITGVIIGIIIAIVLALVITNGITGPINKIVTSLNDGAEQTAAASGQVSSASQQLSQGATEQASSLEETSSSLDQMSSMTKQNADNAGKANQLAQDARKSADEGNQAMHQMQSAMTAINESSDKIAKIIKTIEEIAFQTNLLALNAAVEAARAGEHGKGFAVVAEEVRNLAKRSATAAKDTAELIEGSIDKVKTGSDIAVKAGKALEEIMNNSKKVADIISEIAAASKEQAEGIGQITNAVAQLDQVTQQNASAAEQSASASEELSSQAEALRGMVTDLQQVVSGSSKGMIAAVRNQVKGPERRAQLAHHDVKVAHIKKSGAQPKVEVKAETKKGLKVTKPEEVIPLDEKEESAFKEF